MSDEQINLEAIAARAAAATPGPWEGEADAGIWVGEIAAGRWVFETGCGCCTGKELAEADATFIANARTDIPALLTAIDRLRKQLAAIDKVVKIILPPEMMP